MSTIEIFAKETVDKYHLTWENPLSTLSEIEMKRIENEEKRKKIMSIGIRKKIIDKIKNDLSEQKIILNLKDIFDLDDELTEKFYNIIDINHFHKLVIHMKAFISIMLFEFFDPNERKYVLRHTFFVNMTKVPDYNEAIKMFYFGDSMFDERFLNMSHYGVTGLPQPSRNNKFIFDRAYEDIYLHFLDKIGIVVVDKIKKTAKIGNDLNFGIFRTMLKISTEGIYEKLNDFLNFIRETDYIKEFCISVDHSDLSHFSNDVNFNLTSFTNSMIPDLSFIKRIMTKDINMSYNDTDDDKTNVTEYEILDVLANISMTGKNSHSLSNFYLNLDDKKTFFIIFRHRIKFYEYGDDIIDSIKIVYNFCYNAKNLIVINNESLNWIMKQDPAKYDEILLKLSIIKLIKRQNGPLSYEFFIEYMDCFTVIEEKEKQFRMFHNDFIMNVSGVYVNNTDDNFLYTRLARLFLLRKFLNKKASAFLCKKTQESILDYNTRDQLIFQNISVYNNLSIDVHDEGRDRATREAIKALLDLNEYYEFKVDDPFDNLDQKQTGRLSNEDVKRNVEEFFEYAKLNFDYDESMIFFRVMGCDYDGDKVECMSGDFPGFLTEEHSLDGCQMNGYIIIAYLWEYVSGRGMKSNMLNVIKTCVQQEEYTLNGKKVNKIYSVCNPGKLQRFVVNLLQGRYKLPNGEYVMVDDLDKMKEKIVKISSERHGDTYNVLNPSEAYEKVRPFIETSSLMSFSNANEFFKGLFEFIFMNKLERHMFEIMETLCVYSEDKNGYTIKPDFSIANVYEDMFVTDDYLLITEQIKNLEDGALYNDNIDNMDGPDDDIDDFDGLNTMLLGAGNIYEYNRDARIARNVRHHVVREGLENIYNVKIDEDQAMEHYLYTEECDL